MPAELKPNWKRKSSAKGATSSRTAKVVNIEETLKTLEQKEKSRKTGEGDAPNKDESKDSDNVMINFFI